MKLLMKNSRRKKPPRLIRKSRIQRTRLLKASRKRPQPQNRQPLHSSRLPGTLIMKE